MKTQKQVQVLATYKFNKIARICFTVLSSNGKEKYNTCFDGSADHGSCGCPSCGNCYHLDQLRPVAQAYFESRKQVATPAYDVVGVALQVVNGAMIGNKIGTAYDAMAAEKVAAIDEVRQPTREEHLAEERAYKRAKVMQRLAEHTARENEACHMRLMQQDF